MKIGKDKRSRILYKADQWVGSKVVGWAVAGKIERGRVILTGVILLRGGGRTGGMEVLFRQGQKIRSLVFGSIPISGTMAPINWMFGSNWTHRWSTRRCPMPKVRGGRFCTFCGPTFTEVVQQLPPGCNIGGNEPTFATTLWPLDPRQNLFQTDSIPITFFLPPTTPLDQLID